MANITWERGACTPPFLQLSRFDGTAGCKSLIMTSIELTLLRHDQTFPDASVLLCQHSKEMLTVVCHVRSQTGSIRMVGYGEIRRGLQYGRLTAILEFDVVPKVANWLNVAGLVCAVTMLTTYFFLPVKITNRHYLTVGLVIAVCLLQVYRLRHFSGEFRLIIIDGLYHPPRRRSGTMSRCHYAQ